MQTISQKITSPRDIHATNNSTTTGCFTTMLTSFQFRYTASIALNNVGASLLERRCYDEALEAFTNAITVLHDSPLLQPCLFPHAINAALEKAYHDLCHCGLVGSQKPQKSDSFVRMRVITESDFADTVRNGFDESDDNHLPLHVIRIELTETTIREGMSYFRGTERSIMLNNLATAYLLVATTSTISSITEQYQSLAYQMLQLACSNLEVICPFRCAHEQKDELRIMIVPFMLLILQTLDRLAPILRIPSDAFEHYTTMFLDILEEFLEVDDRYSCCLQATASAA